MFGEYARAQLAALDPDAAARIHRRAAVWLRSRGLSVEAIAHAAAAGDHQLVAEVLVEFHRPLIRNGAGRTFLRWARSLPDDCIIEHPEITAAGAIAAVLVGGTTTDQRRFLRLAREAQARHAEPYVENWVLVARALTVDDGVDQALRDGRRAVELAQSGSGEVITGALAAYARTLLLSGELDDASTMALRALEHPEIEHRVPTQVHAHATLALIDVEHGRLTSARAHADAARAAARRIGTSRTWLGANAAAALGLVLAAEGDLAEAEHELATAEHLFRDEVPNLHQSWVLVLLGDLRVRRGRLDDAEGALVAARKALAALPDGGRIPALAEAAEHNLESARARARAGDLVERPSEAELAVLQLLASDLTTREIGGALFLSENTIRSHKRALYRKLGVHARTDAIARATALGLLRQPQSHG